VIVPVTIVAFIVVLTVLVFIHELGHFTVAKKIGILVEEFAIGFPPRLASIKRAETTYAINAIPVGGYVRMKGENGEEDEPDAFGAKAWWRRGLVLLAGPAMNILFALILYTFVFAVLGSPQSDTSIAATLAHSPARHAHMKQGDVVYSIDGRLTPTLAKLETAIHHHLGQVLTVVVHRQGHPVILKVLARKKSDAPMGIALGYTMRVMSFPSAMISAWGQLGQSVTDVIQVFRTIASSASQLVGPVGIARYTGQAATQVPQHSYGLAEFLLFVAFISSNLGLMNLLPIPALDGGRLVLTLVAGIRRRNLDPRVEGAIHLVGFALLITLILVISFHDVASWTGH
jgi:regulator of sigma E protease